MERHRFPGPLRPSTVVVTQGAQGPGNELASKSGARTKLTHKQIQLALKSAGFYDGAVDGKLGAQTKAAIKQFQKANGLKVDGKVGKETRSILSMYVVK